MKPLKNSIFIFILILAHVSLAHAQLTKKERQAAQVAAIQKMITNQRYVFEANYVNPQRGGGKSLTSEYDLKVLKDSVIAFLPYYGRAYIAPTDPNEGGIKFTITKFSYVNKQLKNGNWDITIKSKENNMGDMRDVQQLHLLISKNGYATLDVLSTNRDAISFNGTIEEVKK